ncbi:MAG TPA: sugar nucleotide-binding protein [Ilumatobacteraceae bacterium]|nr:sugar nucleotide-binding protein [Ilumatobacteraceae bacterium]
MRWRLRRRRFMLITGGAGFLGRHLVMASEADEWELFAPPRTMIDVRQRDRVIEEIRSWRPTTIVHLAVHKGDRQTTVEGSRNVAEAATACGAHLVHVSSDAIFPGRSEPYRENDKPSPITEYGLMKLDAERAVAAECQNAVTVRTSLLYGTTWPAVIQTDVERAINGRSMMKFFTDEFRCPAHAADVAAALSALARQPEIRGPLNVAGPEAVSRAELAATFARWMRLDPRFLKTTTAGFAGMVRPARVVLDCSLAATHGLRCRSLDEALPFSVSR